MRIHSNLHPKLPTNPAPPLPQSLSHTILIPTHTGRKRSSMEYRKRHLPHRPPASTRPTRHRHNSYDASGRAETDAGWRD